MWSQHSEYGQILSSGKEFWNSPANFVKQSVSSRKEYYERLAFTAVSVCQSSLQSSVQNNSVCNALLLRTEVRSFPGLLNDRSLMTSFFSLSVSSWEYGEKFLLFISWLHFKSKLSLENVFWFSHLFTETHLLNFIA